MRESATRRATQRLMPIISAVVLATGLLAFPEPEPAAAQQLPARPLLYTDPECFTSDGYHTITVHGRNFEPGRLVNLADYIFNDEQDAFTQVRPNEYGVFSAQLTVLANYYYYSNYITATYADDTSGQEAGSTFISGICSGIEASIVPPCSDGRNPTLRVQGSGWYGPEWDAPIEFRLYAPFGQQMGQAKTIGPRRNFDIQFTPGVDLGPGEYILNITQTDGESVEANTQLRYRVPCAEVVIEPICAQAAGPPSLMAISISGTGFVPDNGSEGEGQVQIIFDPDGQPQEFFYNVDNGMPDDGSFGPVDIVPYARPEGTYTIQLIQDDYGDDIVVNQTYEFTVPCFRPSVRAVANCGPPAILGDALRTYSISVRGTDFEPNRRVTILFGFDLLGPDVPAETFIGEVGEDGDFAILIGPLLRPPGTYTILAFQRALVGSIEATTTFTVPCSIPQPTLTIDPTCGTVATTAPLAYTVNMVGAGFVQGPVTITFDPSGLTPETTVATADEGGAFTLTAQFNGRRPGSYLILANQFTELGLIAEVSVPFPVTCDLAVLRITPDSGARGFVPVVEGFNFPAGATLLLRWDHGIRAGQPLEVETDESGSFRRQVVIFNTDFTGPRRMTIEWPEDPTAYVTLFVDYLVTSTTVSPPFRLSGNPIADPDATIVLRR